MTYQGSEATRLDYIGEVAPQREARRSFEVVEGAGLDLRERSGVSSQFVARLKAATMALVVIAVLCIARIGVYSVAVGVLSSNATMRTELKTATDLADDLRIQRSVLSSTQRIDRIATQSYGMVLADGTEQMSATAATADDATATDDASDATANDAADTSADTSSKLSSDEVANQIGQAEQTQGDGSSAGANAADVDSLA